MAHEALRCGLFTSQAHSQATSDKTVSNNSLVVTLNPLWDLNTMTFQQPLGLHPSTALASSLQPGATVKGHTIKYGLMGPLLVFQYFVPSLWGCASSHQAPSLQEQYPKRAQEERTSDNMFWVLKDSFRHIQTLIHHVVQDPDAGLPAPLSEALSYLCTIESMLRHLPWELSAPTLQTQREKNSPFSAPTPDSPTLSSYPQISFILP